MGRNYTPLTNTYFSFDSDQITELKNYRIKIIELHDSKIVRLTEFFEGLENSSSRKSLCSSIENMNV